MHYSVAVVGNESVADMLEPFADGFEVDEYLVGEVSEHEKEMFMSYHKQRGLISDDCTFEEGYAQYGMDWNGNAFRKDNDGVWREYSTCNPNAEWDWYEIGGRWPGKLLLKEGVSATEPLGFSYGWRSEDKKKFVEEHPNAADSARIEDIANLDELTSYAVLINGEWIVNEGLVKPYLAGVDPSTIITIVDCHM